MVERDDPRRLELLLHEHGEIADAAADVGHGHARAHAVARQDVALVAPGHLGLRAQDRDEAAFLEEALARVELGVVFLDVIVGSIPCQPPNLRVVQPTTLDVTMTNLISGRARQASRITREKA